MLLTEEGTTVGLRRNFKKQQKMLLDEYERPLDQMSLTDLVVSVDRELSENHARIQQ